MTYKTIAGWMMAAYVTALPQISYARHSNSNYRDSTVSPITSAVYTVQRGDTLEGISRRAGVEVAEIKKCTPTIKMWRGEQLKLYDSYQVKLGDTLGGIAWKKGMTLAEMVSYNPRIKDTDAIYAGQMMRVMCGREKVAKVRRSVVEPAYVEGKERKSGGKRRGNMVRYPSGLELAVVTDEALIGRGKYFNGASRIPLVTIPRADLFKSVSKHFVLGEFVRVEEKEERCIDAKARPYVYAVGGDYYFTHARIDPQLVGGLERVRVRYGKSLELDEGYRPPFYNECVGGGGPHPEGIGGDIHEPGYEFVRRGKRMVRVPTKLYRIVEDVFRNGGRGQGPTTVHVDTGRRRFWRY